MNSGIKGAWSPVSLVHQWFSFPLRPSRSGLFQLQIVDQFVEHISRE